MNLRLPWLIGCSALCAGVFIVLVNRGGEPAHPPADNTSVEASAQHQQNSISGVRSSSTQDAASRRDAQMRRLLEKCVLINGLEISDEERKALAEELARQLLFGPEMDQLLSELERKSMQRAKFTLRRQLYILLSNPETRAEALVSLTENPATINHFSASYFFISSATLELTEEQFEKLKAALTPVREDYAAKVQFFYNMHHLERDPERLFIEAFKLLEWQNVGRYDLDQVRSLSRKLYDLEGEAPFAKIVDEVHRITTTDSDYPNAHNARDRTLSYLYQDWAMKEPYAALDHALKTSFAEPFLDHIAGGVYLRQNSQEAMEWLDSIQDQAIAEKARNIIARRYGSDPIISRVIAEGISDPELRAATFESIENKQRSDAIEFGPNH